jgi:hypothetical protein
MGDVAEGLCASRVASQANNAQLAASFNPRVRRKANEALPIELIS